MQKNTFLVCWLLILTLAPVGAQNNDYRLRIPDIDEYLAHISEVWANRGELPHMFDEEAYRLHMPKELMHLMETRFLHLYENLTSTTELIQAYETLNQGEVIGYVNYVPFINIRAWNQRIVLRWVEENAVDLKTMERAEFGPYTLFTKRHNLTDAIEDDLLLSVNRDDYSDRWLVVQEGDEYRFVDLPTPYYERNFYLSQSEGTPSYSLIQDVNADGLEEIILQKWY
nr:hypothetical protein [Anaerolineae bacterium]